MAISEEIAVDVAGIGSVDALADALNKAAASAAKLRESMGGGGGASAGGADKMAASLDAAAEKINAGVAKIEASMAKLSGVGDSAAGALGKMEESAVSAGASLGEAAAGADELAAANARAAESADAVAAGLDKQAVAGGRAAKASAEGGAASEKFWKATKVLAIGGAVAAVYGIDKAMKLQSEVTRLYTAAGLKGVKPGGVTAATLAIGSKTGFSAQAIAEAMYHPVSAGLDWKSAKGLTEQSANLANIHGANLEDTTYAMSSVMKAYNMSAKQVTPTAALLNSIVGQGDMRFQDFNQSVKNFAPTGASMGISLQSMGAGLAYLTDRGNSAEVASTRLTMGLSMATAGSKAANVYMKDLGLTTGKLDLQNKSLQKTMEAGGLTTNKFAADLKKPDGLYAALSDMQHAFHKAGLSAAQSDQVMAKIFGGGRSDKAIVSLMQNLDGVKQKYDQIGQGVKNYGKDVAAEQDTAQQKWKDFLASGQNLATGFGNTMLPMFTKLAGLGASLLQGSGGGVAAGVLGAGAALFTGKKLFSGVESAAGTVGKVAQVLHIPGLGKLANIGKGAGLDGAAASLDGSAGALKGAAASLEGAAGKLAGEPGLPGGKPREGEPGVPVPGGGKEPVPGIPGEKPPGLAARVLSSPASAETLPVAALFGVSEIGKHANPAAYHRQLRSLQKQNDPTHNYPVIGPVKKWVDSWALPLLSGLGAAGAGAFHGITGGGQSALPRTSIPAGAAPAAYSRFGASAGGAPAKVTVDTSGVEGAKGKVQAAMGGIDTILKGFHPAKIPAPDTSALSSAKGKAQSAANGITQAIESAMKKPAKLPPPDLSAASAAAGKARGIGAGISGGLASGILSGEGAVVAAATQVGNAAAAAMAKGAATHSPSKKTIKTGRELSAGIVVGLQGGQAAIDAAATAIGKNAAKATDIAAIDSSVAKLKADVKGDSGLVKWLGTQQSKLTGLADKRTKLETEITDSQQIAQAAISGASIMNAATATSPAGNEPQSWQNLVTGMQNQADTQSQFTAAIGDLSKKGLNATELNQLVQGGASAGLPIAQGIDAGGAQAISQLNAVQAKIKGSAAKLGDEAAPVMYQAGKDATAGLAKGLKADLAQVDKDMQKIASTMVAAVTKHTGTAKAKAAKTAAGTAASAAGGSAAASGTASGAAAAGSGNDSLSHAGAALSSAASGLSSAASALTSAAAALHKDATAGTVHAHPVASAASGGAHPVAAAAASGVHGGGGTVHNSYTVTVQGSVTTERDLLSSLQNRQLNKASNNWQGGWKLPGRAN